MARRESFGNLFAGFAGTASVMFVVTIILNVLFFGGLAALLWWIYNHMIAPSNGLPPIEVH